MDGYNVHGEYPVSEVEVKWEVAVIVHQYGPANEEPQKAKTAWEKREAKARKEALGHFNHRDFQQIIQHHQTGSAWQTIATAFSIGYQAGKKEAKKE
jgi:hypothetical protein